MNNKASLDIKIDIYSPSPASISGAEAVQEKNILLEWETVIDISYI